MSLPHFFEKILKHGPAFIHKDTGRKLCFVVKTVHLQEVDHGAGTSGFGIHRADHDPRNPRLDNCPGTHRTRFQCDIHGAVFQPPVTDYLGGFADGNYFGMGKRAFIGVPPVITACYYFIIIYDNTSYRNLVYFRRLAGLFNRFAHIFFISCHIKHLVCLLTNNACGHGNGRAYKPASGTGLRTQNQVWSADSLNGNCRAECKHRCGAGSRR